VKRSPKPVPEIPIWERQPYDGQDVEVRRLGERRFVAGTWSASIPGMRANGFDSGVVRQTEIASWRPKA
jgi:hypothetical protein